MKTLRRMEADPDVIKLQELLFSNGYLKDDIPQEGIFEKITHENVKLFQIQHVDKNGVQLESDGIVGEKTWWALKNPNGEAQKNHFDPIIPKGLTKKRQQILELIYEEHAKDVHEIPNGSNRSPEIDTYWGITGVIGAPWCCAFVSWVLKEVLDLYPIEGKHHLGVQKMWKAAKRNGMEISEPKPGDIFIQIGSGGTGHTGFVVGVSSDGQSIYTGEGNCGNRLKIGCRKISSVNYFIDCIGDGQTQDFNKGNLDVKSVASNKTR